MFRIWFPIFKYITKYIKYFAFKGYNKYFKNTENLKRLWIANIYLFRFCRIRTLLLVQNMYCVQNSFLIFFQSNHRTLIVYNLLRSTFVCVSITWSSNSDFWNFPALKFDLSFDLEIEHHKIKHLHKRRSDLWYRAASMSSSSDFLFFFPIY